MSPDIINVLFLTQALFLAIKFYPKMCIKFFKENIHGLLEVSIGHALIAESLYLGIENVVNMYLNKLK